MANFYRKPFIYLPKKKTNNGGNGPTPVDNFGIDLEARNNIGRTSTNALYTEFYLNPTRARSTGAVQLTIQGKDMYYIPAAQVNIAMVHVKVADTEAHIKDLVFNCRGTIGSAVNLQYIYLWYNDSGTWKLAKITPNFNYRQQLVSESIQCTLPSGATSYITGYKLNWSLYNNFKNNSTIQSKIQSASSSAFINAFNYQISDADMIAIMHTYGWTWASGVIDETITL